jgi:hypothetical protein
LEPKQQANSLFINPIFDATTPCWSADRTPEEEHFPNGAWIVSFNEGIIAYPQFLSDHSGYVRGVRSWQ